MRKLYATHNIFTTTSLRWLRSATLCCSLCKGRNNYRPANGNRKQPRTREAANKHTNIRKNTKLAYTVTTLNIIGNSKIIISCNSDSERACYVTCGITRIACHSFPVLTILVPFCYIITFFGFS